MSSINSILTQQDIEYIFTLPAVKTAKNKLDSQESGKVYFTVELTDSIRIALQTHFGLDLTNIRNIPLRWIKGDTLPHIDTGISDFKNTYLVYLNDSPGEFIIGDVSYPIGKNTGYVFNEGLSHHTLNTEMVPRLLLGPMNELTEPVGAIPIRYYSNFSDAQTETNRIGDNSTSYTVGHVDSGTTGGYTSWRIAPASSNGSSSQLVVYPNGSVLNNDGGSFTSISYKKNGSEIANNAGTPTVTDNIGTLSATTNYQVTYTYGAGTTVKKNNINVDDPVGMITASTVNSGIITLTPRSYRYWGMTTNSSASITDADIRAMVGGSKEFSSSKLKTEFTITGPGGAGPVKYAYYAVPSANSGTITSIKAGGFESIAAFDVITRSFINAQGYSVSYDIYVQKNSGTDNVTLIIN